MANNQTALKISIIGTLCYNRKQASGYYTAPKYNYSFKGLTIIAGRILTRAILV